MAVPHVLPGGPVQGRHKGCFDAINIHYTISSIQDGPAWVDAFRGDLGFLLYYFRRVAEAFGNPKPIWITKVGWAVSRENNRHTVSLEQQARYLEYCYRTAMNSGIVQRVFWYVLHMQDAMALVHKTDTSQIFGPCSTDGFRRPAFGAMRNFIAAHPHWNAEAIRPLPMPPPAAQPSGPANPGFAKPDGWTLPANAKLLAAGPEGRQVLRLTNPATDAVRAVSTRSPSSPEPAMSCAAG